MLNQEKKQELEIQAREIRKDIVTMIGVGKAGHLGGSCSLADIVTVLYRSEERRVGKECTG